MKILLLGAENSPLIAYLQSMGETVIVTSGPLALDRFMTNLPDFIVSYGYAHPVDAAILERYTGKAVNLHIGYLPWNRGANPNLWSFLENSPKGVTVHCLAAGINTGDIIAQTHVVLTDNDTLRTSDQKLHAAVQILFKRHWMAIRAGKCRYVRQKGKGTCHMPADKATLLPLLTHGWDTPITTLEAYAAAMPAITPFLENEPATSELALVEQHSVLPVPMGDNVKDDVQVEALLTQ
ncbi:MAG: formyl transferase [Chloroflexota bacterium]|nr:formyl transferase [Chloroflexota bacterium]